jgi:putative membrane protein
MLVGFAGESSPPAGLPGRRRIYRVGGASAIIGAIIPRDRGWSRPDCTEACGMKGIIIGIAGTAIAFVVVTLLLPKVAVDKDIVKLLLLAVVFGIANSLIKPVIKMLTFPINFMTMGLFTFVINTVLVLGVAWFATSFLKITFTIAGFPKSGISIDAIIMAFLASIIISLVTTVIGMVVKD